MNQNKLDELFEIARNEIFRLIQIKNVDIDELSLDLGIDRISFISNFQKRNNDFTFYLRTLDLLNGWEA